jgi:hypothetical protein
LLTATTADCAPVAVVNPLGIKTADELDMIPVEANERPPAIAAVFSCCARSADISEAVRLFTTTMKMQNV